jgi:hypothetical protein
MNIDLTDLDYVAGLQSNLRCTLATPQGAEVMKFLEKICAWTPTVFDTLETNEVIARDATRRVCGTLKALLELTPRQVVALAESKG